MTIKYTNWVVAPFPTKIDTIPPVVSFVSPPTPIEGGRTSDREVTYQWVSNKDNCLFRFKGSWQAVWSEWDTRQVTMSENLPNGDYSFSVQARDQAGNESSIVVRHFLVLRELPVPNPIFPLQAKVVDETIVAFVCAVPRGENGQTWHFEFQIAEDELMTRFVEKEWFSSFNGYTDFSYSAPVSEIAGGTISFTKTLEMRKKYWWRCRVRLAGTTLVSESSEINSFTVGVLGSKLVLVATPATLRADGFSTTTLQAQVTNHLDQVDIDWNGTVDFSVTSGIVNFTEPSLNVDIIDGIASTLVTGDYPDIVTIQSNSTGLEFALTQIVFVGNRMPDIPLWDENNEEIFSTRSISLICDIPSDADNDNLHFKLEIDLENTFDSPDLIVSETRFDTTGWEYFNGINWLAFPGNGVLQGDGKIKYTSTILLKDEKHYYARIAAWDQMS